MLACLYPRRGRYPGHWSVNVVGVQVGMIFWKVMNMRFRGSLMHMSGMLFKEVIAAGLIICGCVGGRTKDLF